MIFRNFEFDVVFSFAEEQNAFVEEVVHHLKARHLNYYYYKEDLVDIWGKDLEKHLSGIYSRQSRLCVIFVSANYKEKVWTKFEMKNAQIRAKKDIQEYVLPFKMDDTELPEISQSIKYLSVNDLNSKELADAIYAKVIEHKRKDTFTNWVYAEIKHFFSRRRNSIPTTIFTLILMLLAFKDKLTPVDTLATHLYERNKEKIKGSICRDGRFSKTRGGGTCSSHHGVLMQKDSTLPGKTMEQCREEAREISWLPE